MMAANATVSRLEDIFTTENTTRSVSAATETLASWLSSENNNVTTYFPDYNSSNTTAGDLGLRRGFFTKADDYVIGTSYILITVLGVLLNTGSISVICCGRNTSREVKIQLINLAVADIISALFLPGYVLIYLLEISFPPNVALCTAVRIIGWGAFYVSPLWNVAIALERLIVVYFPLKAAGYTRKHKYIIAAVVWICGYIPEIENLLHSEVADFKGYLLCYVNSPLVATHRDVYEWLITIKYILPAFIIITVYLAIGIKLVCRRRIGERTPSVKQAQRSIKRSKNKVCIADL